MYYLVLSAFCDFHMYCDFFFFFMYCDFITFPSLNYGKAAEVY